LNKQKVVVTGAAGFIGSHLVAALLKEHEYVIGVDNLATGTTENIFKALQEAGGSSQQRFEFIESDCRNFAAYDSVDTVYHLAALGSVPRSIERPLETHQANVDGFFSAINISRKKGVRRFIYASSSSVYGSSIAEPQMEFALGKLLSPYAATKRINEIYAESFAEAYGIETIGLRFFNVYGPRQSIQGAYSAVIPRWIHAMRNNLPVEIYGTGENQRDFTYVKDVVRALLLAREAHPTMLKLSSVFNVGSGKKTSLNHLFGALKELTNYPGLPTYCPDRHGDRKSSLADLSTAYYALGYEPRYSLNQGLKETLYDFNHRSP
jgi:UDP-N-acetylglucosamine 4-epimerase